MKVLVIPDLHLPFTNMSALRRVHKFNQTYKADKVVQIGDLFDQYTLSKYIKDTKALKPYSEVESCLPLIKQMSKWFPKLFILTGNHDIRLHKRAREAGIDDVWLRDILEVTQAPKTWVRVQGDKLVIDGVIYTHGWLSNRRKHAEFYNQSVVHGHLHSHLGVEWFSRDGKGIFATCVGCLIDRGAYAFRYSPSASYNASIGFGYVTNGVPHVECLEEDD